MGNHWAHACALASSLVSAACGGEGSIGAIASGDGGSSGDGGAGSSVISEIEWEECPALTGRQSQHASCTTFQMPLRHDSPDGDQLEFFVKRLPAEEPVEGQLWLLEGGPGWHGAFEEPFALRVQAEFPNMEIFIPDHRGTARSRFFDCDTVFASLQAGAIGLDTYLTRCPDELAEIYGEDVTAFTTTEAARDVAEAIRATQREGVPTVGYGVSYGGYWLHRVAQVAPGLLDSLVFDSALRPNGRLSEIDLMLHGQTAGQAVLTQCAADAECTARLGEDPAAQALAILEGGGSCSSLLAAGLDRGEFQWALVRALDHDDLRNLVPAVLYRLARCDAADVDFIVRFRELARQPTGGDGADPPLPISLALNTHISQSEVVTQSTTLQTVFDVSNSTVFADVVAVVDSFEEFQAWPVYAQDDYVGQWAEIDANVLILQAELDTQAPAVFGRAIAEQYQASNQYYVEFAQGAHSVVDATPEVRDGVSCGESVLFDFLRDPSRAPSADCATEPAAFSVTAPDTTLMDLAGHTDPWDNP